MSPFKILIVGPKTELPAELSSLIARESGGEILPEATSSVQDALTRLSEKAYQAIVCWAERQDELAGVILIRKSSPDVPILVVNPHEEAAFTDLARRAGATRTEALPARDLGRVSKAIRGPIESGELFQDNLRQARRASAQATEVRAGKYRREFVPLLVEDDAAQALLWEKAFQEAGVAAPLSLLKSGEEAVAYFSSPPPSPSLVLLDLDLRGFGGLAVLEGIRRQPTLARIPVVVLGSTDDPERVRRSYALGANSYLLKPADYRSLVDLVVALKEFWGRNVGGA
jgi:CheY-like chemotaxis protein